MGCSSSKNYTVNVQDECTERGKTGEESATPLPEGEFGDFMLGLTDYGEIKVALEDLDQEDLYCDPDFPANDYSLYYNNDSGYSNVEWLRPKDLVDAGKTPHMLVDGISRDDVRQGELGDCWFLSSCAAVSQQPKFMMKIIPDDRSILHGSGYKGIVHFRFWRFGQWVDVYTDDRLPTVNRRLIYSKCDDPTEFWVALLEKAYAKIHGSYQAIEGGVTMDAIVDLTGGLAERYELKKSKKPDPHLYRHILSAHKAGAFIACSVEGQWQLAKADPNGLVSGHAYTVTQVLKIKHKMGEERLLRIRNPWGNEVEWKGSWSDGDSNWDWVDEDTKNQMEYNAKPDGEFWISYKDFCQHFLEVTICTTGPDFDGDGITDAGYLHKKKGEWKLNESAGGSRNNLSKFATNPQYLISLQEADDFNPASDNPELEGKCSVIVELMQEHRRSQRHLGVKTLQIGFILYKTDDSKSRLTENYFQTHREVGKSGAHVNLRQVCARFELEVGDYVVIPSTFQYNEPSPFILRIFAEKQFSVQELTG